MKKKLIILALTLFVSTTTFALGGHAGSALDSTVDRLDHFKRTLAAVAEGKRTALRVMVIGDSLAQKVEQPLYYNVIRDWLPHQRGVQPVGRTNHSSRMGSTYFGPQARSAGGGRAYWHDKVDWNYGFTGSYGQLDAVVNPIAMWSYNSKARTQCDRILIPYAIEAGGGSFKVLIADSNHAAMGDAGHVDWADPIPKEIVSEHALTGSELIVSTSGSSGLGVIELEYASVVGRAIQLVHSSGDDVRYLAPMFEVRTAVGINKYVFAVGSNDFSNATQIGAERMGALMAVYKPDLITTLSNDADTSYDNFIPKLASAIATANLSYDPSVLMIGQGPQGRNNAKIIASNLRQRQLGATYGYAFYDSMSVIGNHADLVDVGWQGDGVHLSQDFYNVVGQELARHFGLHCSSRITSSDSVAGDVLPVVISKGGEGHGARQVPSLVSHSSGLSLGLAAYGKPRDLTNSGIAVSDFSIEFYGSVDSTTTDVQYVTVFGCQRSIQNFVVGGWALAFKSGFGFSFVNETTATTRLVVRGPAAEKGELVHVVMVVEPSTNTVTFYKNGSLTGSVVPGSLVLTSSNAPYLFGNMTNRGLFSPTYQVEGTLSRLRVFNRALSAVDVDALERSKSLKDEDQWGILGGAAGCVASYSVAEEMGRKLHDDSSNRADILIQGPDDELIFKTKRN